MASPAPRSARRVSIWNNLLWLVAAVFFAATVWSGVRLVHDDRGLIVRMTAHDKAVELATLLSVRLHGMGRSDSASVTGALEELLRLEQLDTSRVLRLDRETVALTLNGSPIFGSLPNPSRFQGSAPLHEDLSRYVITVSISGHQLPMQLLFPFSHERLLTNGLFILATIVTLSVAILSSRRELRLVEARSNFVAGVSHDLRMPLAQILLAGETISLGRERGEEHRRTLSASIVREARRLVALVD
ncbi:MAG TPA: histidine kinase dimerization/phospho-acceptor domain-containing protein, partial [Gemmatimonadaceae bacterium]